MLHIPPCTIAHKYFVFAAAAPSGPRSHSQGLEITQKKKSSKRPHYTALTEKCRAKIVLHHTKELRIHYS